MAPLEDFVKTKGDTLAPFEAKSMAALQFARSFIFLLQKHAHEMFYQFLLCRIKILNSESAS